MVMGIDDISLGITGWGLLSRFFIYSNCSTYVYDLILFNLIILFHIDIIDEKGLFGMIDVKA